MALMLASGAEPGVWYQSKPEAYFSGARADLVQRLATGPHSHVLEVGCGTGATGALTLLQGKARHYAGVELFEGAARVAQQVLSEVVVGDVEQLALPWSANSFDALILSEVLEHLIEPWALLRRLNPLLKPGAQVLASSPNISHWRVIRELVRGRFELADQGVFDRTHMRWFTPASFRAMFERAGFEVVRLDPVTPFSARTRLLSAAVGGRLDHLFTTQICLEARRRG